MRYARIQDNSSRRQTLLAHAQNVARYAAERAAPLGLRALLRLCGLLHDAGKASDGFQDYLLDENAKRGTVEHSAYGAVYAMQRWHGGSAQCKLTAELIASAITVHHGKLPDMVDGEGNAFVEQKLTPGRFADQDTVMAQFFEIGVSAEELDALFEQAVQEVTRLYRQVSAACADLPTECRGEAIQNLFGLAQRSVYGLLIDADRLDAYRFEAGLAEPDSPASPWPLWQQRLEDKLADFPRVTKLDQLRAKVSEECKRAAEMGAGVYRLCVPTGGGKTYASMRYALEAAQRHGFARILYVAPYKAILEQTADNVRKVFLGGQADDALILEHHSDALPDDEADDQALRRHQLLAARWDVPLVLTTMVQFLNTLFAGPSACARRFAALQNAVIILDEAQSIPLRCLELFNLALRYLAKCCGCAVVLCTATQPLLDEAGRFPLCKPTSLITDEAALHEGFRRVQLLDMTAKPLGADELAARVLEQLPQADSALCIVNTKATAAALYAAFRTRIHDGTPLYCLTTRQCPAHRLQLLGEVRALLKARMPVVCVATQLIEAGVDVSFGLAVRALAGLDSVAQAAGRCNRNAENPLGEVWLVRILEESLAHLRDIENGQKETQAALNTFHANPQAFENDLLSPRLVEHYFRRILRTQQGEMSYPFKDMTLVDLLSSNAWGRAAYRDAHGGVYRSSMLSQAFRTAGRWFSALDGAPFSLLAPYQKGAELQAALETTDDLAQTARLLRAGQRYTIAVYAHQLAQFQRLHCVRELSVGCYALDAAYYDDTLGLLTEGREMELYEV